MIKRGDIITAKYLNGLEQLSLGGVPAGYQTRATTTRGLMPCPASAFAFAPFYLDAWFNPSTGALRVCYSFGRIEFTDFFNSSSGYGSPKEGFQNPEVLTGMPQMPYIGEYVQIPFLGEYRDALDIQSENDIGRFTILKTYEDGGSDSSITSWKLIMGIKCSIRELSSDYTDSATGYTFSYPFQTMGFYPTQITVSSLHALRNTSIWGDYDENAARFVVACCEGNRSSYKDSEGFYYLAPNRKAIMEGTATSGLNSYYQRVNGHILPSPHVRITEKFLGW